MEGIDLEAQPQQQPLTGIRRLLAGQYDVHDWDSTAGQRELPPYIEPILPDPPTYLSPPTGDALTSLRPIEAQRPTYGGLIMAHFTALGVLASFVGDLSSEDLELPRLACYVLMFGHETFGLLGLCWWHCTSNG